MPGAFTGLQPVQDLRVGGRISNALYQFTLQGENLAELNEWGQRVLQKMRTIPQVVDVSSDQQRQGAAGHAHDRPATASRLGITTQIIDNTLYDAFGQRQVSITYTLLNQYHVVMEVEPRFWQRPDTLKSIYVPSSNGPLVPLSAFTHYEPTATSLAVNHQSQFPSITTSFNLAPGVALGDAVKAIEEATRQMGMPPSIRRTFSGTAQAFKDSACQSAAFDHCSAHNGLYRARHVVRKLHPPGHDPFDASFGRRGRGTRHDDLRRLTLSVIAIIGILLLIGIVKKNGILMVDFAIEAERKEGKSPEEAIFQACLLRFRPIMMTTMAALLGALPLAVGHGVGSELRRPLGIAIVGGLIFSQMLTLYTTPVVYLYLDRFRLWFEGIRGRRRRAKAGRQI